MMNSTIRGGLPVEVTGRRCRAEPDVGISAPFIEDIEVFYASGHAFAGDISTDDLERLEVELLEWIDEPPEQEREPWPD